MARNGKKKMTVDFAELDVYRKRLDEIGGGATERAFENALKDSQKVVAQNLTAAMAQHNETGKTAKSIIQNSPLNGRETSQVLMLVLTFPTAVYRQFS